jgi:hypothetical protein
MTDRLRDQLIGAWKLVFFVEKPLNGSSPNYAMGERPTGIITYTPDGYMSAQLMRPNPGHFAQIGSKRRLKNTRGRHEPISPMSDLSKWTKRATPPPISCSCRSSRVGSGKSSNELRGLKATFCTSALHRQSSLQGGPLMPT